MAYFFYVIIPPMNEKLENDLARENLTIANNFSRVKAYIIDDLLISLIVFAAFYDTLSSEGDIIGVLQTINSAVVWIMVLKIAYQILFIYMYGATVGKMFSGIVTVSVLDLAKPSFNQAVMRSVMRIFSEAFFYFGFVVAFLNPYKQTWHDKLAKTIVIDA